jgi:hypothetical protein
MGVGGKTDPQQPFNSSNFLSSGCTGPETGSTAPGTATGLGRYSRSGKSVTKQISQGGSTAQMPGSTATGTVQS